MTAGCVNPHTSYYGENVAIKKWNTRIILERKQWEFEEVLKVLQEVHPHIVNPVLARAVVEHFSLPRIEEGA